MKDINGREYLKVDEAKAGMDIELDDGFTCCRAGKSKLKEDMTGLFFDCEAGGHFIDGQLEGNYYIGIYKCN